MSSLFIRSFSLFIAASWGVTAVASGPTWALPHAHEIDQTSLELNAGYAQFPQGGLALARLDLETPVTKNLSGALIAHQWMALGQLNQRFFIGSLRYRMDLTARLAIAPFVQSVFFDGGGSLDRRLSARSGVALQHTGKHWLWDLSLPIIGVKNFPTHPTDSSWSMLGTLYVLLATETGVTWAGWNNHAIRLGIMGTLTRLSYRTTIKNQKVNAQLASMGSHSFLLIGWEKVW